MVVTGHRPLGAGRRAVRGGRVLDLAVGNRLPAPARRPGAVLVEQLRLAILLARRGPVGGDPDRVGAGADVWHPERGAAAAGTLGDLTEALDAAVCPRYRSRVVLGAGDAGEADVDRAEDLLVGDAAASERGGDA